MNIAVLADIHANLPALQTVADDVERWRPDAVIVAGDLVNRGPRSRECLDFVMEKVRTAGWLLLRGNHEDYVLSHADPATPRSGLGLEIRRLSYWTYQQVCSDLDLLQAMPLEQKLHDPQGGEVHFVHGSLLGLRDGIYPETLDCELPAKTGLDRRPPGAPPLALFCVGHTHRPLVRRLNGTLIVNAGSVGLPFDQDTRLAYARLSWQPSGWQAEIVRLKYDLEGAKRDFTATGYLQGGGPLARLVLIELETASSHLYNWSVRYQSAAERGEISMEDSVQRYLA